ncbi:MAG: hypothetical protein ACPHK8_02205 [Thermoplasmatota archaeon]
MNGTAAILFVIFATWFGATFLIGGLRKNDKKPYAYFRARAQLLWKDRADAFLAVVGCILITLALLVSLGVIW